MERRATIAANAKGRAGTTPRRLFVACVLAALLPVAAALPAALAGDAEDSGTACRVPAFLLEEDAGLSKAYDGVRQGLEESNLPRVCLRRVEPDDPAQWERVAKEVSAEGPPFVVVLGRRAAARVLAAPFRRGTGRIPTVFVDVAILAKDRAYPQAIEPPPPAAVVRAEVPVEGWGKVVRSLLPGRPQPCLRLSWSAESPGAAALRAAASAASGLELRLAKDGGAADAMLDWSPGVGETVDAFDATLGAAKGLGIPVLSTDRARFGRGAAVVLVPDHRLLGRVAADAARRLRDGEGADLVIRRAVRATEVWVDLQAADEQGLKPPLPFLAGADLLRKPPAGTRPEGPVKLGGSR